MKSNEQKRITLISKIDSHSGKFKMLTPLNKFDMVLWKHAVGLITAFEVFRYDEIDNEITESEHANEIRATLGQKYQLIPLWLSFSTGTECLAKAVLIKHDALDISSKAKTEKYKQLRNKASNYQECLPPYEFLNSYYIDYTTNQNLTPFELRCVKENLTHLYNLQIGTMDKVIQSFKKLHEKNIISEDDHLCLANSLQVLTDIRRNIDAHTFHMLTVGANINGDLANLYLPAINKLLKIYQNATVV